jgi:hypothetical protein
MSSSGFGASVVSRRSDASPTARVLILLRTSACRPEARASRRQYASTSRPARRSLATEQVGGPRTAEPVRLGVAAILTTRPGPASSLTWCLVILVAPTGRSRTSVPGAVPSMFRDHPAGLTGSRPYSAPTTRTTWPGTSDPAGRTIPGPDGSWPGCTRCGLSPIKPNELAARRYRQARPVGSRCHTQAWLSYGPLRPGLLANARAAATTPG